MQEEIVIGNYKYNERYCIGQGSYGKVYRGINKLTQRQVAIKEIDGSLVSQNQIKKEISILKTLKHKNIVEYEDAFQNQEYFYIVTEYCNGGDLRNLLEDSDSQINLDSTLEIFFQVCQGFRYLRKFEIIHRDLKPSNILINNGIYKIADFGLAKTQQLNKSIINNDLIGVPIYMSPQILSRNYYTYKCDIWSIGIILYELFFEKLPWKSNDVQGLFFQIMNNPTPYLHEKTKPPPIVKNILEGTLRYLEKERLDWGQLISLQRGRKKIFGDGERSRSISQTKTKHLNVTALAKKNTQQFLWRIESAKGSTKILPQFLHHIKAQFQSLEQELLKIINKQCYSTFLQAIENCIQKGPIMWQCLLDCSYMILTIAELQSLESSRDMLVLLELIHDMIKLPSNPSQQLLQTQLINSKRNERIDQYAAQVISKINTLCINRCIK